jgi:hypothetical protein
MGIELQPYAIGDIATMAQAVVKSRLFNYDEAQLVTLMLIAQSQGIHPIKAAMRYSVIQGKPAMKADAMLSDFQTIGGTCKWITESSDCEKAEAIFTHPVHAPDGQTVRFTVEDARRAKLLKPDSGWEKYPASMLRARVVSSAIRMVAPGIVAGLYTPEEVADFAPLEAKARVFDAKPASIAEEPGTSDSAPEKAQEAASKGGAPRNGEELDVWLRHYIERHDFPDLITCVEDFGESQGWGRRIDDYGPSDVEQLLPWLGQLLRAHHRTLASGQERGGPRKPRKASRIDRNAT